MVGIVKDKTMHLFKLNKAKDYSKPTLIKKNKKTKNKKDNQKTLEPFLNKKKIHYTKHHISQVLEYHGKLKNAK